MEVLGGGTFLTGSTVNVASGTVFDFNGSYTIASGVTLAGAGTFGLYAGTLTVNGNLTAPHFQQTAGLLAGLPVITGGYDWQGGNWSSGTTTTVGAGGVLTISTVVDHDYNATAIVNNGTVNWQDGNLRSGSSGSITNTGTWNDNTALNYQFNNAFGGGTAPFTNNGTYIKTGASTTSDLVPFTNSSPGTIDVTAGTLSFTSTFANTNGSVFLGGGSAVDFPGALGLGSGTLTGTVQAPGGVTAGGLVQPVNLTITGGGLTLQSTSVLALQIGGPIAGTDYSLLAVSGSGALDGQLVINFTGGYQSVITPANTFTVLTATSALTGSFTDVANGARLNTADGFGSFVVNYGAASAFATSSIVLSGFQAVPEPSTGTLLGIGLVCCVLRLRRHRA